MVPEVRDPEAIEGSRKGNAGCDWRVRWVSAGAESTSATPEPPVKHSVRLAP